MFVILVVVTFFVLDINALKRNKMLIKDLHDKIDSLTGVVGMYVIIIFVCAKRKETCLFN